MFILPINESFYIGNVVVVETNGLRQSVPIGKTFYNYPVNINRMISFKKSEFPIARASYKIHTIDFWINENAKETWYFETKDCRDQEYEVLLRLYVGRSTPKKEEI